MNYGIQTNKLNQVAGKTCIESNLSQEKKKC